MNAISKIPPRVNLRNLSIVGYANGFTQRHYRANRISDVLDPGFFDNAKSMLEEGDHINVSAPNGGAVLYVGRGKKMTSMFWCEEVEQSLIPQGANDMSNPADVLRDALIGVTQNAEQKIADIQMTALKTAGLRIVTEEEWDDHWNDGYGAGVNTASRD